MERKWSIKQGLLTPISFRDKASGREWLRGPGRQPAPHPGGDLAAEDRATTFTTRTGKLSPVEAESLVIDMASKGAASSFHCRSAGVSRSERSDGDLRPNTTNPI